MKAIIKKNISWLFAVLAASTLHSSPLEEAEKFIQAGKSDAAVEMMRAVIKKDGEDPCAEYNLGLTLYRAGRYEEAVNVFQAIDAENNKDLQSKSALQLGNIQFRLAQQLKKTGQPVGAVLSMERALGYYESANEIKAGKESKTNEKIARARLELILLGVAESQANNAARLSALNRLTEEEPLLRNALQAYQRAGELNPGNRQISPLIAETTRRLVINLDRQGEQLGKEADDAKDGRTIKGRRQQAIAKYDDALALDPNNPRLAAARDEQLKKMSALLTDEAAEQASAALAKPELKLNAKDQSNLEQAKDKLEEALSLDAANAKAADLNQQIFKKLEESYVNQGNEALKAAEAASTAQKKLDFVKGAADQFGKALAQNPENQPAQEGLKKAEAQLPALYGAAGQADLAKALGLQSGEAPSPGGLSNPDLKKTTLLLDKSVENLDTALALQPGEASYQKSLEEAQKMLDAANDEANKRALAAKGNGPAQEGEGGQGEGEAGEPGEGKMLPLSLSNAGSKRPVLGDKFWNKKIRDW